MKKISFIIVLSILAIGLFAQVPIDPVFSESEIVLKTSSGDIYGTLTVSKLQNLHR